MILHCDYCNSDMLETENWKCPNCGAGLKEKQEAIPIKERGIFDDGIMEMEVINGKLYAKKTEGHFVWDGENCEWNRWEGFR